MHKQQQQHNDDSEVLMEFLILQVLQAQRLQHKEEVVHWLLLSKSLLTEYLDY